MKRIVLIVGSLVAASGLLVVFLLPSLMRAPRPEEVVPPFARQELLFFYSEFESFKSAHQDRPPASVAELVTDGHFLAGVVEPHRTKIPRRLEYPIVAPPALGSASPAVAAYHVAGFGDFFLLADGSVVERRLQSYTAASYRQAQRMELDAIRSQQDGAANRSQPVHPGTNQTSAAAGSGR
jgi:hypothetical protein